MTAELLWNPSEERQRKANITAFMRKVNKRFGQKFRSYDELYDWSIENIPDFWAAVWDFAEIRFSINYDTVVDDVKKMPGARWFRGARLNYAENLLRYRDEHVALIFKSEARESTRMTYAELYDQVARCAKSMRDCGVIPGDRVVGFLPNMIETVVAMLASASIGAVWSSCSPDFGINGVLDRFGQIEPKILFTADGYFYNGKTFDSLTRVRSILEALPTIEKVVVVPYTQTQADIDTLSNAVRYQDFLTPETDTEILFEQVPSEHPLYIMFTSGTTGLPKCMVHGTAGILINLLTELLLQTDVKREDTIFYFTTCGWMMWNWLLCSLAVGATVLLYDGSPFYPDNGALWKMAQDEKMTIFGTSAKYLAEVERRGVRPGREFNLTALKAILSTGSPLSTESFRFVYTEIKDDLQLSSISGGSDIIGCFVLGNPIGPVYAGEIQKRGLGKKIEVFDSEGNSVRQQKGELVCTAPLPNMPLYFWDDPDDKKYIDAYFSVYPDVWCHGDYAELTENNGMIIYGRSDATLKPGGVRIGTAEIYRQVDAFEEVNDSLVVGQDWENDVRIILFVKMNSGIKLTEKLINAIKSSIKQGTTPHHVPAKVIAVDDIPYTINMKKVELAVRHVIQGQPVLNRDALANPDSLELYENLKELKT